MKTVHIVYAKDGDRISIVERPWWTFPYQSTVDAFCPCCSWRGWLWDKLVSFEDDEENHLSLMDRVYLKYSNVWQKAYLFTDKFEKRLYETEVENGCLAFQKIFKTKEPCHRSDCENCWEYREDAFSEPGRVQTTNKEPS